MSVSASPSLQLNLYPPAPDQLGTAVEVFMATALLLAIPHLTNEELAEIALAVATEQSQRLADAAAEPAGEPAVVELVYVTAYGKCGHQSRNCTHLRRSRTVQTVPRPNNMRSCRSCGPREE